MSSAPDRGLVAAHDPASTLDDDQLPGADRAPGGGPDPGEHHDLDERRVPTEGGPDGEWAEWAPRDDRDADRDRDWAWVEEWRQSGEPAAWGPGLTVAAFCALVVGIAVWVLTAGLADMPLLSVAANILVALGLAPALWLSRSLPVLRWIAGGGAAGVVIAWLAALMVLT